MEQVIKINVPKGKKAVYNETTQVIEFVDIDSVRSKSWDEFCKNHPVGQNEWFYNSFNNLCFQHNTPRITKCLLSSKEDAEGILALIQLTRLHDEWIRDWKGDYNGQDEKYQIVYSENEPFVTYHFLEHSLLEFPNQQMAREFMKCFEDLIMKARRFI